MKRHISLKIDSKFINFKKWFILEKKSEFDFEHKDDEYLIKKVHFMQVNKDVILTFFIALISELLFQTFLNPQKYLKKLVCSGEKK